MSGPTEPIELLGDGTRLPATPPPPAAVLAGLAAICPTVTEHAATAQASRDWWPLAMHWALGGAVAQRAAAVCSPTTVEQVAAVLALCHEHHVPVTAAGGRSGVCGASVPWHGGVLLDLTSLAGVVDVDAVSGIVRVRAGTFGPDLEETLSADGLTVGHFPQSFELATVGGWVASRGAGQFSTRYGKIEEMVVGLEVVMADGTIVRTGGHPAAATGPDLTQLFTGSEGTLGVITEVTLRAHPLPEHVATRAYRVPAMDAGIDACRRIIRRGATPAVLRLYDAIETQRSHGGDGSWCALLVLDQGDRRIVEATLDVVGEACADFVDLGGDPVDRWMAHRNDTSALQALIRKGFVVDTMEVAGAWSQLDQVIRQTTAALAAVPHSRVASCHISHSYLDGACAYFTFAATPPPDQVESTYVALWDAGQRAALQAGANLSHHHGIGVNRARFMAEHLGSGLDVLRSIKWALDPRGILNPGKLALGRPPGAIDDSETMWP